MAGDEPKIFIDEGWKAQVQREKELAEEQARATAGTEPDGEDAEQEEKGTPFMMLVNSLATQALFALGLITPPNSKQVYIDIEEAGFSIEMLLVLREKTKGNLEPEEEGMLAESISELQRAYAVRAQQVQEAALKNAGVHPNHLKNRP